MARLQLLGGAALVIAGQTVGRPAALRHRLALLALLARAPGRSMSRERLAAFLWPEADTEHSRNQLRVAVHALRKALGRDVLRSAGEDLLLDETELSVDASEFDVAIAAGDLEGAAALHAGPFLENFHLPDAEEFERWAEVERAAIERSYAGVLERLAAEADERGDLHGAVEWWERVVARDPWDSRLALALMHALVRVGNPAGAIRHARLHTQLLRDELGAPPDVAVAELVRELTGRSPGAVDAAGDDAGPVPAHDPPVPRAGGGPSPRPDEGTLQTVVAPYSTPIDIDAGRGTAGRRRLAGIAAVAVAAAIPFAYMASNGRDDGAHGGATESLVADSPGPGPEPGGVPVGPPIEKRVVVPPFRNDGDDGEPAHLGSIAADAVVHGLAAVGGIEVVPSMITLGFLRPPGSSGPVDLDPAGWARLAEQSARETRSRLAVSGSYVRTGEVLRLAASVVDPWESRVLVTIDPVRVPADSMMAGLMLLQERVAGAVAALTDAKLASWTPVASRPGSYEAYRLFADAMQMYLFGNQGSSFVRGASGRLFEQAAAADTAFSAARLWAIKAYINDADFLRADSVAQALLTRRAWLPAWDRAMLDYFRAILRADREGAYRAIRAVVELVPTSEWRYLLGAAAMNLRRPREALSIFEQPGVRAGWVEHWPYYRETIARARHYARDYAGELRDAMDMGAGPGGPGEMHRLRALAGMGRTATVLELLRDRLANGPSEPHFGAVAFPILLELRAHGHRAASDAVLGMLLDLYDAAGPAAFEYLWGKGDLSSILYLDGRYGEALELHEQGAARQPQDWGPLAGLARVRIALGDTAGAHEAERRIEQIPGAFGETVAARAQIAAHLGETERALALLRQAYREGLGFWINRHISVGFLPLQGNPEFEALMGPAG